MKKKLAILAIVLVILYPGVVWLLGLATQERMTSELAQLSEQIPWMSIVEQHYQRGWYRSQQELTFELRLPGLLPLPMTVATTPARGVRFTLRNVIHHGPVCGSGCFGLARVETSFVPGPQIAPFIARLYGSTAPLSASTRLGFFGGRSSTVSMPPLRDVALKNGSRLDWGGLTFNSDIARHADHIELHGVMPGFSVRSADGKQLSATRLTIEGSSERALGMLYGGRWDIRLGRVLFSAPGTPAVSVEKIRIAAQAPVDAGFMDLSEQVGTGAFDAAGTQLRELHFDFAFRHLQLAALAQIQDQMRAFNRSRGLTLTPDVGALSAALRQPMQHLLLAHPELRFDRVGVSTANGQLLLTGSIRAPGLTASDFAEQTDPRSLVQKLEVDLDLTLDDRALADIPALAAMAQQRLPALRQAGLIAHDNGRWHTHMHLAGGHTTFNGRSIAMPGMASPPPAAP